MKKLAKDLIFISQIERNGLGIRIINYLENEELQNDTIDKVYEIHNLSISKKTYIAIGFNSFVVKIKQ